MTERSRSPNNVKASDLGIGVAVIISTCGVFPFSINFTLCSTPKRCCSSIMTSPSLPNFIFSSRIACVPMIKSSSRTLEFFVFLEVEAVIISIFTFRPLKNFFNLS